MKRVLIMALLAVLLLAVLLLAVLLLPCYATEAVAENEGVGDPALSEEMGDTAGMSPEELKLFLDEKVIPYVIVAFSAVTAIYIAISPILAKIKSSSHKFDMATGDLAEANKQGKAANEQSASMLDELRAEREVQRAEQAAFESRVAAQLQAMADTVQTTLGAASVQTREIRDMVKIGFCNNKDLVARGYAKQIARIAMGKEVPMDSDADCSAEEIAEQKRGGEVDENEPSEDEATA